MGWKASALLINPCGEINSEELLTDLGFAKLTKIKDETFDAAINPSGKKVYIGKYKDTLIITTANLPTTFLAENTTPTEKLLISKFPDSEICAIVLHSVVNLWGYSVIKNGQKIRARAGSADDGTTLEYGEPLEEEKELLGKSTIGENGARTYLLEDFPDEPFTEDQVGENFVFSISSRYFGEPLDCIDELLFETVLTGYSYSKGKLAGSTNNGSNPSATRGAKPWWKFW